MSDCYPILNKLIKTAEFNELKDKNHATYSDEIRYFATYIFLLCGRSCYEMLRSNLPIPSVKTICKIAYVLFSRKSLISFFLHLVRCIDYNKSPIIEGQIRAKDLSDYLDRMKTTKYAWMSENATAIIPKVTYDPSTNQLVGLILPTDKATGLPKSQSYTASDAGTIKNYLAQNRSNVVYLVMAQPLDESIPPYVVQMFGSNNQFDTADVVKRWNFTKAELKK